MNELTLKNAKEDILNQLKKEFDPMNTESATDYFHEYVVGLFVDNPSRQDEIKSQLELLIKNSPYESEHLLSFINLPNLYKEVDVRFNWDKALASVNKGYILSKSIGWGFFENDIKELAKLHKAGLHRQKIEDLLEDCNFHKENADFQNGHYDSYLMEEANGNEL